MLPSDCEDETSAHEHYRYTVLRRKRLLLSTSLESRFSVNNLVCLQERALFAWSSRTVLCVAACPHALQAALWVVVTTCACNFGCFGSTRNLQLVGIDLASEGRVPRNE